MAELVYLNLNTNCLQYYYLVIVRTKSLNAATVCKLSYLVRYMLYEDLLYIWRSIVNSSIAVAVQLYLHHTIVVLLVVLIVLEYFLSTNLPGTISISRSER